MLIGDIISTIKTTIKARNNHTIFQDQYIYNLIKSARAKLIFTHVNSGGHLSNHNYQTICVKLKREEFHDCACIEVGCEVLKSEIRIPTVVVGKGRPLIVVREFSGSSIPYVTPDRQKSNIYSETLADRIGYFIQNDKIIIWNSLEIPAILVEGVFNDPSELEDINICNSNGDVYDQCSYDPRSQSFPVEEAWVDSIIESVLRKLNIPLSIEKNEA